MDKNQICQFISEQKTAFIASVNEQGFPVIRAMLAPRKIDGDEVYFTTNTSSNKIKQYAANNKACIYFYKRGKFKYQGVSIIGEMEICTDQPTKDLIWRSGDEMFYKQGVTDSDYCVLKFKCMLPNITATLKLKKLSFKFSAKRKRNFKNPFFYI